MRNSLILAAMIVITAVVPGCQCLNQMRADFTSQTAGLDREVVLYNQHGNVISRWHSKTVIDLDSGAVITFFDSTGHRVLISDVGMNGMIVSTEH